MENSEEILLSKWLEGTINDEELSSISEKYDLSALKTVLDQQKSLDFNIQDSNTIWKKMGLEGQKPKTAKGSKRLLLITGLAFLAIICLFLYKYNTSVITIKSPVAKNTIHILPDNSKVTLSPLAEVKYSKTDWHKNRNLQLDGQAYFEVVKGSQFSVDVPQGSINVLGTKFEVIESKKSLKVNCTEGKVKVFNNSNQSVIISENQSVSILNQKFSDIFSNNLTNAEFLNDRIKVKSLNTAKLANELKRFYEIDVIFKKIDPTKKFTGVIILNDLKKACEYISKSMKWEYEIENNNKVTFKT